MTSVEMFDRADDFLEVAADWLATDPVQSTVIASVTHRLARDADVTRPGSAPAFWWMVARDATGEVAGAGMRTAPFAPYPPYLLAMPAEAAVELAGLLHARGERVEGVNGALPAVRDFADEYARLDGRSVREHEHTRLFELPGLAALQPPQTPPSGHLRAAVPADVELCLAWFRAFFHDVDVAGGRVPEPGSGDHVGRDDVAVRIAEGCVWLWEVDGAVVHLTATSPPSFGVVRVGPVYTPEERRGHGYAAAAVAEVTRQVLQTGHRACLFTDQANPVSNRIYTGLGYRPVVDMVNLRIETVG